MTGHQTDIEGLDEVLAAAAAPCGEYQPAEGGAWPWCHTCGWRFDRHPNLPDSLRRMAERKGLTGAQ